MKKFVLMVATCTLCLGLFIGCSSGSNTSAKASSSSESATQSADYNLSGLTFQGIDDQTYADIFKNNKMTMVNIMATWCSPCIKELPELEQLNASLQDKNVGLVAVVVDTREGGKVNQQAVKEAVSLKNQAGVTFPMLIPDAHGLDGFLNTVQIVPTTIFVDSNGNIVGAVTGSRNYQAWMSVVTDMESKLG